jgi:hypothetical protein
LQAMYETLSKRPFKTMKDVMLLNESKKVLNSGKK